MTENERLTHSRASGIKTGYWSPSTKAELVERLAAYEDTGLEPQEVQALADDSRRSDEAAAGWISVEDKLPPLGQMVIVCREYAWGEAKVEQGCRDLGGLVAVCTAPAPSRSPTGCRSLAPPKEVSSRDQS